MPGVGGYRGDHCAGNGPYAGPGHHYGGQAEPPRPDPYTRVGREYARAQDDPYSYGAPTGAGRNHYEDREDPYSARLPTPDENYGRYPKEDPYALGPGRNGKVEDLYSHVNKDRSANGRASPRHDHHDHSQYEMDHLATFTVGSKQGLMSPADGIRKLRQMEMSTGIWTMRIILMVESRDLVIIDRASQEEMERFPVSLVMEPTAVTNEDRRDVYNNIVLFTVTEDPRRGAPSEMHMFQCVGKPAHEVVDDIKTAKVANAHGPAPKHHMYDDTPPPGVRERLQQMEQHAQANYDAYQVYQPGGGNNRFMKPSMRHDTDNESVISERTDRDVPHGKPDNLDVSKISTPHCQQLLNHCFDDIEKFVGRLQYAAEAFRELDKRRRGRGNDKHKNRRSMGDGMLSMRARPPPAKDFTDIFQKFKLSFNLLAKLKPHIHDPNAPELVHFLFTPLSLVVEASKDPRSGRPDLGASVVAPMLTADSKELLTNCLTSKETDLWDSLGDAWRLSRDEWKGFIPPYYPRFSDGWEPPRSWSEEPQTLTRSHREESPYEVRNDSRNGHGFNGMPGASGYRDTPYDRNPQDAHQRALAEYEREFRRREHDKQMKEAEKQRDADRQRELDHMREREREREREAEQRQREQDRLRNEQKHSRPSASHDPHKHNDFLRQLRNKNARASEALHAREGRNNKELTIDKGEIVEVLDSSRNWWKVRNSRGDVGHVPYTILQDVSKGENSPNTYLVNHPVNKQLEVETNLPATDYFNYSPRAVDTNRSLSPGSNLGVSRNSGSFQADDLPVVALTSTPSPKHVTEEPKPSSDPEPKQLPLSREPSHRPADKVVMRQPAGRNPSKRSTILPAVAAADDDDDDGPLSKTIHSIQRNPLQDNLTGELMGRMASGELSPRGNVAGNLLKTPDVFINMNSSEKDVRDWLRTKGFSQWLQNRLNGFSGKDILKLKHTEIEALAEDEATRLESQITLSKKVSGYTLGKSFELDAILRSRKEEIDHI